MDFDEISVVKRGANQRAHIVLFKADTEPPAERVTIWGLSALAKELWDTYGSVPDTYRDDYQPVAKAEFEAQYDAQMATVPVAKADSDIPVEVGEGIEDMAAPLVEPDLVPTREQAIAKVFERDPGLYDAMYGSHIPDGPWRELAAHDANPVREHQLPGTWITRDDFEKANQAETARKERLAALNRRVYGGTRDTDRYPRWGYDGAFR
jgi:hypothetical protein